MMKTKSALFELIHNNENSYLENAKTSQKVSLEIEKLVIHQAFVTCKS